MKARGETVVTRDELRALPEYSCSLPTGTTVGKRWRRDVTFGRPNRRKGEAEWLVGEYYDVGSKEEVGIKWTWAVSSPGVPHRGDLS